MKRIAFALLLLLLTASCEEKMILDESTTTKIVYNFHDSSVPPEYHRSYEITMTPTAVGIVVDSYGDILHEKEYPISSEEFSSFIGFVNASDITACKPAEPEPCSGGTSEGLEIFTDKKIVDIYLDHCGPSEFPKNCGEIEAVIARLESYITDLSDLLR
ncbi:MAG: hypothetical protein ABJG68_02860 [Crocinitomicaceae bacterium]